MMPKSSKSPKYFDMMYDLKKGKSGISMMALFCFHLTTAFHDADPHEMTNLFQTGKANAARTIGKAEHLKILLMEWM